MNKTELIRRIYAIVLSVFIVAVGIALICVAADIYYSGEGPGKYYSREIVGERLKKLAIPLLVLVAAIIAGAIFPLVEGKVKRSNEETLRKLQRRMPASAESEEFAASQKAYAKMNTVKISVWCSAIAVALACSVATIVYLATTANFEGNDLTGHMLGLVKVALPCTLVSLAVFTAASYVNGYCAKEQVKNLKTMIRYGSKEIALPKELALLDKANKVASHNITLWAVRGAVLAIGIIFIILGVLNGGATSVLGKAIKICSECIGIG